MKYLAYDPATSRPHYFYESVSRLPHDAAPNDLKLCLVPDDSTSRMLDTHYTPAGIALERPSMSVTTSGPTAVNGVWRVDGIPQGALVTYPGGELIVDDGFIEWSSAVSGVFKFTLSLFPFLDKKLYAVISEA